MGALCDKLGERTPECTAMQQIGAMLPPSACKAAQADMEYTTGKIAELRKDCTDLATKLCTDIGEDTESCSMVKEQTPNFPPPRCKMMLDRYDEVLADLRKREEANKPLDEEKQAQILADAKTTFGAGDAKVQIVEFSDFQCQFCARAADAVSSIKEKYGDKVHFVFRQFPLRFHKDAHLAAQAALAANEQGKFWEYHDLLFDNQGKLKRENLEEYAKQLKLNMADFKKALDKETFKEQVDAELAMGTAVAVSGTPTIFINGKRVQNPLNADSLAKEIDAALAAN